ncbi:MAG: CoA transferase [Proteobacteria bacterium]|nr:CoA transferase [Pseudomonadota bacterium]
MQKAERGPLAGLTVIDWTHVLAGPFVGYQLGLLGAEVIRVERADGDDMIRAKAADPALARLGLGEAFITQNAGKRSVALNMRDARSRQAMEALIAKADVLLENFRPGKLAKLGFDPARLIERHPRLVVCSVTGFGQGSDKRAYDHVVQAASGLMAANADAEGRPQRIGFPVVDYAVGQQAAMAVLAALLRRSRAAESCEPRLRGEWMQVSMMGAALTLMAPAFAAPLVSGVDLPRSRSTAFSGNPLPGTFPTGKGYLAIVCNAPDQGEALLRALAQSAATPDEATALAQAAQAGEVERTQQILGAVLSRKPAGEWVGLLNDAGVPVSVVAQPVEAARSISDDWPAVAIELPTRTLQTKVPGIGFQSTEPLTARLRIPPRRGQHTREVLAQAGLDARTIDAMLSEGAASESSLD